MALQLQSRDGGKTQGTQASFGLKECYKAHNAIVDIVFVHGLTGSREETWTDSGVFWPGQLLKENMPKSRIFSWGYDADVAHFWAMVSQNRIGDHARDLVNALAQERDLTYTVRTHMKKVAKLRREASPWVAFAGLSENSEFSWHPPGLGYFIHSDDRPIIFVAHSLGGLVTEDALLTSLLSADSHINKILEHTWAIAFLGTPHCGSDLAKWATIIGSFARKFKDANTDILRVLEPASEVLARIQQGFHNMMRARSKKGKRPIEITCLYEQLAVRGVGEIVPKHSAILAGYNAIGIHADHMGMTKFSSLQDQGYKSVAAEIVRWARSIAQQTECPSRQGTAEGTDEDRNDSNIATNRGGHYYLGPIHAAGGQVFQGTTIGDGAMFYSPSRR